MTAAQADVYAAFAMVLVMLAVAAGMVVLAVVTAWSARE